MRRTGQKLLKFDRKLDARFVAGTDEAGRGSLAGPLVVAGVLLDYACLREHRVRPLTYLNDSKQVPPDQRDEPYRGVVACAERIVVRVVPADEIDRRGLHRSNLDAMRAILHTLTPPAEACLVDGDTKSAAIAAASIVAKVTRDRLMRRMDSLYPQYGFSSHVGYITPAHSKVVLAHGPCPIHRRSWRARCYAELERAQSA